MRALAIAAVVLMVSLDAARALDRRHDEKLERAAAGIVAARMGSLRGGFGIRDQIGIVSHEAEYRPPARIQQGPLKPGVWQDGLAIAVERKTDASPDL